MQTGQKIKELRTKKNLTQKQLADILFVSRELISKWELGQRKPSIREIRSIAELFSVSCDELIDITQFTEELNECIPPGIDLNTNQMQKILNSFLCTLSIRDRAIFLYRYYNLEDSSSIGAQLGMSSGSVRTILMRIRKKMKKYLKEGCGK